MEQTPNQKKKIMSIRLDSGGLSFYLRDAYAAGSDGLLMPPYGAPGRAVGQTDKFFPLLQRKGEQLDRVDVFLDTFRVVYVPAEALDLHEAAWYLRDNGSFPTESERVVVSDTADDLCAVMAFSRSDIEQMERIYGDKLRFFSPMQSLHQAQLKKKELRHGWFMVYVGEHNIYIKAGKDSNICCIEAYPYATIADVAYYIRTIAADMRVEKPRLVLCGTHSVSAQKTLKKFFKSRICE